MKLDRSLFTAALLTASVILPGTATRAAEIAKVLFVVFVVLFLVSLVAGLLRRP